MEFYGLAGSKSGSVEEVEKVVQGEKSCSDFILFLADADGSTASLLKKLFELVDTDKDGKLNPSEYAKIIYPVRYFC